MKKNHIFDKEYPMRPMSMFWQSRSNKRRSCRQGYGFSKQTKYQPYFSFVTTKELALFPYRIHVAHKLTPADCVGRVAIANAFNEKIGESPEWLGTVWFSDESQFSLNVVVNRRSCVFKGTEKPDEVLQKPLYSEQITLWAAMSRKGLINWPILFEN